MIIYRDIGIYIVATLVTTLYTDDRTTLARFEVGTNASFDTAPNWLFVRIV